DDRSRDCAMIAFVAPALGLFCLMLAFIGVPLVVRRDESREKRRNQNVALYRQRVDELASEVARGEVAQGDFAALKNELEGTLLHDVEADETVAASAHRAPFVLIAALALVLGGAAVVLYQRLGALDLVMLDRDRALLAESDTPQAKLDGFAD